MAEVKINSGDTVRCETCRRDCMVRTVEWEASIQLIVCQEGIRIVGVDHDRVPQHLIVDYAHLDELVV